MQQDLCLPFLLREAHLIDWLIGSAACPPLADGLICSWRRRDQADPWMHPDIFISSTPCHRLTGSQHNSASISSASSGRSLAAAATGKALSVAWRTDQACPACLHRQLFCTPVGRSIGRRASQNSEPAQCPLLLLLLLLLPSASAARSSHLLCSPAPSNPHLCQATPPSPIYLPYPSACLRYGCCRYNKPLHGAALL